MKKKLTGYSVCATLITMNRMRTILKNLMDAAGDTPYDIQKKVDVPRTTTYRFLAGGHAEPRTGTVQKWAKLYNVTESQLRGDAPIDGIERPPEEPKELKEILLTEEYNLLSNLKKMNVEARVILYQLSSMLAKYGYEDNLQPVALDRRDKVNCPNNQLRAGEVHYKTPIKKNRIQEKDDTPRHTTGNSEERL